MNCAGPESLCLARRARHVACVLIAMVFAAQAATAELPNLSDPKVTMETWMRNSCRPRSGPPWRNTLRACLSKRPIGRTVPAKGRA